MSANEYILAGLYQQIKVRRNADGIPLISATTWEDVCLGLGWMHGRDRGGQIGMMRLVASGRLCEVIWDHPVLLELDRYYRHLGFARHARESIDTLDSASRACIDAYCRGINQAWEERRPGMLQLFRYRPEPFTAADVLTMVKLMSYAGLAEGQRMVELFIVEAVRRGVDETRLRELLPALDSLDPDLIHGLRAVPDLFPAEPRWWESSGIGSNSWAVRGAKTESGNPILCNDPHLQVDRLPATLYEARLHVERDWVHGATIPGIPGVLSGRNRLLAWGVVNACADNTDFFIERCREGRYQQEGEWLAFRQCREQILRKQHPPEELLVYENEHGILEGDPWEEGDYLCWAWCGHGTGGVGTMKAFLDLLRCRTIAEARQTLREAELPSLNVVLADQAGNIGLQMIGRVPRRREGWSGLAPVAGWDKANDWQGWLDPAREVPSLFNPEQGFIATANEARRHPDGPLIATVPQPSYRRERIEELLAARAKLSPGDMQAIQYDVLSVQARRLLPLFLPYVPEDTEERKLLEGWDLRYTPESQAATLFENIYYSVLLEVFGNQEWMRQLLNDSLVFMFMHGFFDEVLMRDHSTWLPGGEREEILSRAVHRGLERRLEAWGRRNAVTLENLFLGGRLPRLLGFDAGPYPLPGSRATICMGARVRQYGKDTFCAPAYHFVTDLGGDESWTNLPGGASESRFSRYYTNELGHWLGGDYKKLRG